MDNSWQSKCGSMWPFLTPAAGSSSQVQPQEGQNQMLNAGYHFYSHVGQEPSSSSHGIMQEPTFPRTSNLSFHNSGHTELGSSFLSLLSGPPSLLQCDLQQLSNQKPFFTSDIVPVNTNNIMIRAAGSDVSCAPTGLLSQTIDSKNLKTGVDLPQNVSSRTVTREKYVSSASLHDILEAANLNRQNSEVAKAVTHHTVSSNDKMKELSSLRGGWPASPSPSHVRKMHNTNIQLSPSSSIPLQSFPFTSSCPRVFCLGASGDLVLSNTGLLGVVCSCHGLHMSISKFSEHSGLRGVNPADAVRMDSGETIAQWRKVYFQKFGIRVPEDHSGWDWPEGFSAAAGLVKCTSTMPNIARSSDLYNLVGHSGALLETVHPWNISFSNTSIKGQKLDNGVLHNGIKQMNAQDGWNFLNGIVGTSGNNVHEITENQIMNCPISGCSTMSKFVGKRSLDNGPQSISCYVDSISKSENSFISFPNLQNFKPPEKVCNVVRFSNLKEGDIVDRAAIPSNIELRLGQPSQQNQAFGNPVLPSPKSHLIDKHDHLQKSLLPGQLIHNSSNGAGNSRAMEEYRQYLHFAADTTSNRREQSNLSLGNRAYGVYSASNAGQREEFKGDASRCSFIPTLLSDVNNSSEGKMQYKATNIAVSSGCILTGRVLDESHIASGDTISFSLNRGNGAGTQFSVNEFGIHKDLMKGKGVGCMVDFERVATQSEVEFHSKYKGTLSNSDGLISEIGCYTCSSVLEKSSHPSQLPNVPTNTSDVRNLFNYPGTVSRPQHNGNFDYDSLRSSSLPMDSGLTFPSQAVSIGLSRTTSFSVPNVTPTLSTREGIGVSPHLLNENLRMLALGHILKISNQDRGMASLLTNQDERRSDYCFGDKMLGSVLDPSTSTECRRGLSLAHKHDAPEVSKTSLNSGATRCMGGDSKKLAPVADLNKWRDFSVISQGTQLHSDIETRCQILCDSRLDEQPSLRLGRSEITNSPTSGTGKCCQRVPYEYFPGKCCCAVHTSDSSKDCDFKLGTSCTAFREQVASHGSRASMSFASNFDGDSNFPNEKVVSVGQSDELKKQESKRVVCHAFQWRDVPNKVTQMCNVTYKDERANSFDGNISERVASAKCFDRSAQDAESVKDQELSNISSGCSAPAITQASVGVDNRESFTVDAQDTRSTSNLLADEGSGIDILSSDDAHDSERSSNFDGFACEINSMDNGSLKTSPNQSSRSLIDELRRRDSLRLKRKRNQINTGPTDHENSNYFQNCEGDSKSDKRKKAKKWRMLDESFHPSVASPAHDECYKRVGSFEQQYGSLDLLRPDHRRFPDCSCSSGTTCKCRRPPLPSSRTSSRKRDWHRLYDGREGIDGFQTQLRTNDDCLETHEASHGKMLRSDRPAPIGKVGWVQEPKFTDAELSVKCNSADCVITSSSHQVNVCKRKARPVVCGKYGVISNCDTSKPAKILSIRNILRTARRTTLGDNSKLNLSSVELKKRKNRVSNGSEDKYKEDRDKADVDAAVCSKLDAGNPERKANSVCFPVGNKHDDASYMLDEERQDRCQQNCTNHNNCPVSRSKPKSREVRKRSLYELSTQGLGKDPNCTESSVVKESNSAVPTQCIYMGEAENYEGHGSDVYNDNKVSGELRCQSISDLQAYCCVCGSSNKDEVNCLLECNRCLIRVHQACYGVAKVPKAHWYCRPCRTGSKNNVCVLCGYGGGAMTLALQSRNIVKGLLKAWNFVTDSLPKNQIPHTDVLEGQLNVSTSSSFGLESDSLPVFRPAHIKSAQVAGWKMVMQEQMDSVKSSVCCPSNSLVYNSITAGVLDSTVKQWVHMVCGLWTPGTRCPNVNTMSAFDVSGASRPKINVVCSICYRSGGSCIRCRVLGCTIQFHPWCAHRKGLLQSEVEGVDNENVGFYGRCELHAAHYQCNSGSDPADAVSDHPGQKELKCARTEGYKGRKRDGFRHTIPNQSDGVGGCLVPHEQLNAWLHINKQKSSTKGLQKLPASDIEYDCRKEYTRYKQSKGWASLVVYKSGIHGLGLYTSQFISRGAMVVEYVGEIVGLRVADKRERDYQSGSKLQYKSACYFFRINKENIIDATQKGGIARFVNHSCMPNCVAKVISVRCEKKVVFFAERDIYPGEEITYDYHFNHEDEGKKIPCFCNSKNCRRYLN